MIPLIPAVQIIVALWGVIVSGKLLGIIGLSPPPANDQSTQGTVYVLSDHPSAAGGVVATPVLAGTVAPTADPAKPDPAPSVKEIMSDTVNQPWSMWGLAALMLTAPLFIAQVRAGAHEAAGSARSVYNESQSVYRRVDQADDYTANRSRRRRK